MSVGITFHVFIANPTFTPHYSINNPERRLLLLKITVSQCYSTPMNACMKKSFLFKYYSYKEKNVLIFIIHNIGITRVYFK